MTQQNSYSQPYLDKKMTSEEFTEVIAAIAEGKYSWACVLILKIAGYNPLHYIPYRTYNRLIKENLRTQKQACRPHSNRANDRSQIIEDLEHLETVKQPTANIRGGSFQRIFNTLRRVRF